MKAVKGNKVYTIDETSKARYVNDGFDVQNDSGEIITYGKGKTVPYEQYAALKKELEELKTAEKETTEEKTGGNTKKPDKAAKEEGSLKGGE